MCCTDCSCPRCSEITDKERADRIHGCIAALKREMAAAERAGLKVIIDQDPKPPGGPYIWYLIGPREAEHLVAKITRTVSL